jgi:hypothetical protein
MAESIPNIPVDNTAWVDLNTESSISVGTKMLIQNQSNAWCRLYEGATAPSINDKVGTLITNLHGERPEATIPSGSLKIWALSTQDSTIQLNIQEL